MARSSHFTFPRSTSIATARAVNALLEEPIAKSVRASTLSGLPTVRTPYPLASTTESFRTTATASPGTCHAAMLRVTYPSKPSSGLAWAAAAVQERSRMSSRTTPNRMVGSDRRTCVRRVGRPLLEQCIQS